MPWLQLLSECLVEQLRLLPAFGARTETSIALGRTGKREE